MLHFFARRMKQAREDERGFTLIELLVVIIIIGILAAIAIPTFLAQRERAQNSSAESDLRNMTAAATAFAADNDGSYAALPTGAVNATHTLAADYDFNPTDGVTTTINTATADSYTAQSQFLPGGDVYTFDSEEGQVVTSP